MRKRVYSGIVVSILLAMIMVYSYQAEKENVSRVEFESTPELIQEESYSEKYEDLSTFPMQCILLENGNLVRLFHNVCREDKPVPTVQIFDIYDTKENKVLKETDISEYHFWPLSIECGVFEGGFYIKSKAYSSFLVFSNEGEFLKKISFPEDVECVCLSEDLTLMAYQQSILTEDESFLMLKDLVDGTEKEVYQNQFEEGKVSGFLEISFRADQTGLYFRGMTNPIPEEQSLDCYGTLELSTGEITFTEQYHGDLPQTPYDDIMDGDPEITDLLYDEKSGTLYMQRYDMELLQYVVERAVIKK